jgi:predicted MFS family arabinose efflux permease
LPRDVPAVSEARLRWVVFALAACAFWLSFFHRVSPTTLAGDLARDFAVGGAALGALAATYFYVYAAMQLPTGVLVDTQGPRRVLTAGGAIAGAGALLFGAAETLVAAALGRSLIGLGVSVAFVSLLKLAAVWFHERRFATVTGIANMVGISGALVATAPLAWLLGHASWRTVLLWVGAASLAVAALTWRLVRDAPPGRAARPTAPSGPWYEGLGGALRNPATWPPFWVNFGVSGAHMSFIGLWLVPFLTQAYGYTPLAASHHAALMLLAFAVSAVGVGVLSDRLQRRRPVIIGSCLLYGACWAAWWLGVPAAWTYVLCAAMGACVTGFSLSWAVAKEVNAPRCAGMAMSIANTGGFAAAGILQPLAGWVLDASAGAPALGGFRPALAVLGLFSAIGLVGALFIRETRCRNIWESEIRGGK